MVTTFAAQVVGALLPHAPLLVVATATGLATEAALFHWQQRVASALDRVHADIAVRQVMRDLLLVSGLLNLDTEGPSVLYLPMVSGLLLFYALHFAGHAAAILVRRTRTLPVVTRNIDASALRLTPGPPVLLTRPAPRLLVFGLPTTAGLLATAASGVPEFAACGIALAVAVAAGGLGQLVLRLLPSHRPASEADVLEWFDAWLAEYRPTVGMYFSGSASSAYQANMWLEPLARLEGRPLIVLRERFMVQKIAATDIPVVCLPKVATLMRLEHSTLRVLIHPANSGKTSQVLRIPTIKHAFVNHGESDKASSCNPYAKAYDEVWVAGPAARERYALADVGVDDRDVVEIGRPQLQSILPYTGPPTRAFTTVLYAPTWEGWDGAPGNTSLLVAGENIVRALLDDDGIRLLYKPHPMTGSVDPRAGAADLRIRELIREANRHRSGCRPGPERQAELALRSKELMRLTMTSFRRGADAVERMLLQGSPEPGRAAVVGEATVAWEAAYWASLPEWEHQTVAGAEPALYTCFNQADLLISDVSSVVSDFLASGKPYAVVNADGMPEQAFLEAFPTVGAATILTPDASGVSELLTAVRDPGKDKQAKERAALKLRLLGPSDPPSVDRFSDAAQSLVAAADAHRARITQENPRTLPRPRPSNWQDRGLVDTSGSPSSAPGSRHTGQP
ncbi:hypothetical protein [Streptomyces sp. KLOTTS4A1]|uniref:hypothetical protein n=1 Tax=Streptomyces sp. KLOTTS4A1 TaxID=3390996 RepID=UPI0039F4FC9F